MKLSEATVNSIFYDNNTLYNGSPIKWIVANHNSEGTGITALMMYESIPNRAYDAKEPQNPDSNIRNYGYGKYSVSNILQWMNSDAAAGAWYSAQHEYDQAPNSDNVGDTYANQAGFLNGFSPILKGSLQTVTKMSVSRKVHIPGSGELNTNVSTGGYKSNVDVGTTYTSFQMPYYSSSNRDYVVRHNLENSTKIKLYNRGSNYFDANSQNACTKASTLYIPLMIYVPSDLPVTYSNGAYYLTYNLTTPYNDYGSHKLGFSFQARLDSGASDSASAKVYIDNVQTKTLTMTPNTDTTVTLADSDVSGLSNAQHTVRIEATQNGLTASTSFTYTKIAESIPVILKTDVDSAIEPFSISYQVYDDDGDDIDVSVTLGSTQVASYLDVQQHVNLTTDITSAVFDPLAYGEHTITISATDGTNTSTSDIDFTKNSLPTVALSGVPSGQVEEPFNVTATYDSADGDEVTIRAFIDDTEIEVS